jgi:transcriptional regulator with XRE-family HTH domain
MDLHDFGLRVRRARMGLGLTQRDCARLLGMPAVSLCAVERGRRQVYADRLADLALALGVSSDYLLGITPQQLAERMAHPASE